MNGPFYECGKTRELSEAKTKDDSLFCWEILKGKVNAMGRTRAGNQRFPAMHERFTSDHFYERRVVSLHGESGSLKHCRERVGTGTTHLAPWSKG